MSRHKAAYTREAHRDLLSRSSRDFREGVAYACEVLAQEIFWTPLSGHTYPELLGRVMAEAERIRAESSDV